MQILNGKDSPKLFLKYYNSISIQYKTRLIGASKRPSEFLWQEKQPISHGIYKLLMATEPIKGPYKTSMNNLYFTMLHFYQGQIIPLKLPRNGVINITTNYPINSVFPVTYSSTTRECRSEGVPKSSPPPPNPAPKTLPAVPVQEPLL